MVSFVGIAPVSGVGPFAQSGLDEAFGFAVGLRRVRTSAAVLEAHLLASVAELVRTITAAVVSQQSAHADAVASEKVNGILEEGDGGVGLLIGQDLSEGQAGVIVDGDVQGLPSGMFVLAATASVGAPGDLLEAGHALDVEMEQIAGSGMFVAHDGRGGCRSRQRLSPARRRMRLMEAGLKAVRRAI